jgi:hypothetical protein
VTKLNLILPCELCKKKIVWPEHTPNPRCHPICPPLVDLNLPAPSAAKHKREKRVSVLLKINVPMYRADVALSLARRDGAPSLPVTDERWDRMIGRIDEALLELAEVKRLIADAGLRS